MKIENCKLILATSVDEFGDICTRIEDKGNGNAVAANDVDDDYENLFLAAPEMHEYLDGLYQSISLNGGVLTIDEDDCEYIGKLLAKARGES